MKGIGFTTILLAFVTVLLVVSVALLSYVMVQLSKGTGTAANFWKDNKLFMMTPTIMNVVGMATLGVLMLLG